MADQHNAAHELPLAAACSCGGNQPRQYNSSTNCPYCAAYWLKGRRGAIVLAIRTMCSVATGMELFGRGYQHRHPEGPFRHRRDQQLALKDIGADLVQGFAVHRPARDAEASAGFGSKLL